MFPTSFPCWVAVAAKTGQGIGPFSDFEMVGLSVCLSVLASCLSLFLAVCLSVLAACLFV